MAMESMKCECCSETTTDSVQVADAGERLYLPHKQFRVDHSKGEGVFELREFYLCHPCKRFVEDNFRASIAYLKAEKGLKFTAIKPGTLY